ncbi:VanZ family protein [Chryseomicrobium palamuruense]|uniref:VanZ family protein n=1 Tax=Chryseomicrobium palamuruense TaxID=682973 RepID=A0ABV8UXD7_9BACL
MKTWKWWALVGIYMGVIFYLSHQPATSSNELSTDLTEVITETVGKIIKTNELSISDWNHLLRKNTHFFAYLGLGLLTWKALSQHFTGMKNYIFAWGITTIYAMTDELHQLFVPGRGGQVSDVLLDSAGAATGLLLLYLVRTKMRLSRK